MHRRHLSVVGITAIVAASAGWGLTDRQADHPTTIIQDRSTSVTVATAQFSQESGYAYRRQFTGRVEASRHSALGFELAGRVERIAVREGESVDQGQVLARLDTARLDARYQELEAGLEQARAARQLTRATLSRQADIVERGGVSRQGLDEAREAFQAASAGVALIERQIDSVRVELDKSLLRAPYAGVVVVRGIDEGEVVDTGTVILELQESGPRELRIGVAGRLVDELVVGRTFHMQQGEQRFEARLRSLLPVRAAAGRTVDALFDPVDTDLALRPGDLVRLHLSEFVTEPGIWLPLSALAEGQRGSWNVYVAVGAQESPPPGIAATHRIQRRLVEVLYQDAERVYVRGRFSLADRIVTNGLQRVVPNQWVHTTDGDPQVAEYLAGNRRDG